MTTVYIVADRPVHYHTDSDCVGLKQARAIEAREKTALPDGIEPCQRCADPSPLLHETNYWRKRLPNPTTGDDGENA